jgi:hypothetical protein
MKTKTARNILIILLSLLGLGATFGGGALILSPSGALFKMPLYLLDNTPFHNFLIPGILLFGVLGVVPIILVWALLKKPKCKLAELLNFYKDMYWAWTYCIYIAFALIIWIQVEMFYLQSVHWSHLLYMLLAIAIIFVALLPPVRKFYFNKQ